MKPVIDMVTGVLAFLMLSYSIESIYYVVKKETVLKVHKGLPSLEVFTQKLTKMKLCQ